MSENFVSVQSLRRWFDLKPGLSKYFRKGNREVLRAVDDVSFDIKRGQTFCLVGESGCGKSTVAKLLVGLISKTSGNVQINGQELHDVSTAVQPEIREQIQMIFQDPYASLNPRWRVGSSIAEPLRFFGERDDEKVTARIAELLVLVGLHPDDAKKYPHEFSGGQRQRIAIARALASNPKFIVCDEPTSALDVSVQAQILNLMKDLQDKLGLTYLFISHNLAVVKFMADVVGVMYLGKLVEAGPKDEIFANPKHPYTKMLMRAVPEASDIGLIPSGIIGEVPNPINPPSGCTFHPRCPIAMEKCKLIAPSFEKGVSCHAV